MPLLAGAALMAHGDHGASTITAVILAIMGLAIVVVIVSSSAKSATVATTGGSAIAQIICTALSPVTHAGCGKLTESVTSTIHF